MKKYFIIVLLFLFAHSAYSQILITEVVDGTKSLSYPRWVELTNEGSSTFNLQNYKLKIYMNGTATVFTYVFPSFNLPAGESVVVTNIDNSSVDQQWADYTLIQPTYVVHGETNTIRGNGNDCYELLDVSNAIIDVFGEPTVNGLGQPWEYTDSYAYRNMNITSPNSTFTISEWTIAPPNTLDGLSDNLSPYCTPGYRALSSDNDILTFSIPEQTGPATINTTTHRVDIEVTAIANLADLTPTITISPSATINPLSGESQDFSTSPFVYTVTAQDLSDQAWNIYVTQASGVSSETDILSFTLTEQTGAATINTTSHTVDIEVNYGTDVTTLSPTISISSGASISPLSGSIQNFTSAVVYTVTAEDGTTVQPWTVNVTEGNSSENDILTFVIPEQTGPATINTTNHTVDIEVTNGAGLGALTPSITISTGATINPLSGTVQNFTNPFTYTVTAQDATPQDWTINVSEAAPLNNETDIVDFTLIEQTGPATINTTSHTVNIEVVNGTNLATLTPIITISTGASLFPASNTQQDFTSLVVYTVTAENGSDYQNWSVSVTEAAALNSDAEILSFVMAEQTGPAVIDSVNALVNIEVAYGVDVSNLSPNITVSAGASVSPLSGSNQNFTLPFVYTVTAQDGSTKQWTVYVSVASKIESLIVENNFKYYPNPVNNELNIVHEFVIKEIRIFKNTGEKIIEFNDSRKRIQLYLNALEKGTYLLEIRDEFDRLERVKFVKH